MKLGRQDERAVPSRDTLNHSLEECWTYLWLYFLMES